jgi:hypothetical protein
LIFVNSEPEAIGATTAVGQLPAELLGDLEGQRLGALGVVRAHVDVDERPVALARQLGAQAVDVVVVAVDRDEVRAVDAGREDLLLLEVGRDEDVGLQAERGGVRGDRVGQVARRGAGDDLEAELAGRAIATETTRSLNECVGFAASFLIHTSPRPRRSASRSALISGVQPDGRPAFDDARSDGPGGCSSGRKSA